MGWLIALGLVTLLAVLPLGVRIRYDCDGILVKILAGPVRLQVMPRPKKEKPPKAKKKPAEKTEKKQKSDAPAPKEKKAGGSLTDFLPLVRVALQLLNALRRKLRVDNLELKLVLGGGDPCDLAVNYGKAWAALGNLLPRLERVLTIRKRDINVECDFTADSTLVTFGADITITLGRLLALAVVYGLRAFKEFLSISKKRKGGAAT